MFILQSNKWYVFSALFFNNCFYLAHSLIGPPWKNILPSCLADLLTTVLLECIQDLRVVGLEKISIYLQTQRNTIVKSIEETGRYINCG